MSDRGNRRSTWPPSCTGEDGSRWDDLCPRTECDLVDRFWKMTGWCGCGPRQAMLAAVLEGLEAHGVSGEKPYRYPGLWAEANLPLAYQLDAWGLTEHGTILTGGWLTPDGVALRDALRVVDFGTVLDNDHKCGV